MACSRASDEGKCLDVILPWEKAWRDIQIVVFAQWIESQGSFHDVMIHPVSETDA